MKIMKKVNERFKIGDTVICISSGPYGLQKGEEYTVDSIHHDNTISLKEIEGHGGDCYKINKFKLKQDKVNEALLRDKTKKQMQTLLKNINRQGGDIGSKVRKEEKYKEDKIPNAIYMDNPFASNRFIDTWEHFSTHDAHIRTAIDKMNDSKRGKIVENFKKFDKIITENVELTLEELEDFEKIDSPNPFTNRFRLKDGREFDVSPKGDINQVIESFNEVSEESFDEAAVGLINDLKINYNVPDREINEFRSLLENGDKQEFVTRYIQRTQKTVDELPEAILASELLEKASTKTASKEEKAVLGIDDWIQTLDSDVIGTTCDKIKPMFSNRPNRANRASYDVLRTGKFLEFKGYTGQIIGIRGSEIELDIIVDDKHVTKKFPISQVLKTLKNSTIQEDDREEKK